MNKKSLLDESSKILNLSLILVKLLRNYKNYKLEVLSEPVSQLKFAKRNF